MKIQQLTLLNFKLFHDVTINFEGKSAVIFGENGCGKSSILEAINLLCWNWINRLCQNQGTAFRSLNADMINKNESSFEISASLSLDDDLFILRKKYAKSEAGKYAVTEANKKLYDSFIDAYLNKYKETNIPIMVNYGTNRSVIDVPLRIRKKHQFDKWSSLENALENTLDFRTFFEWIRNREDLELETMADKRDFNYRDIQLECVRKALLGMLDGFSDLKVRRNPLKLTVKKNGIELAVNQLSDGEKCTLALFGDLARRLGNANPNLDNPLMGSGIVLIDEIELHMHPAWQRKVLRALRNTFPNVQFIITTHSPQVLGETDSTYTIIRLDENGQAEPTGSLDGCDSNTILEEHMGTDSVSKAFRARMDNVYSLIYREEFDAAEEEIRKIKDITDQNSQNIIRMEGSLKIARALHEKNRQKY